MTAPLALVDATLGFPKRTVLRGVSLEVPRGVHAALLGPNGAGKSTLLRTLAGIQRPLSGRVLSEGSDISELAPASRSRRIAYLPQQVSPEIPFTVHEVVLMGRYPHRGLSLFASAEDREVARRVLEETGLAALRDKRCTELSGGEFQRVLVASILAQGSPVMLLDEPTASLDLRHQSSILGMTRGEGRTVVVATHDVNLAAAHCSFAILLDAGGGISAGPADEILTEPALSRVFGVEVRVTSVDLPAGGSRRQFVVVS